MSAEEFGGIGFAPGSVRGTRSFSVDKLGRLTGVSYKQVWTPGENTASCRKDDDPWRAQLHQITRSLSYSIPSPYSSAGTVAIGHGSYPQPPKRSWVDAVLGVPAPEIEKAVRDAEEEKARAEAERLAAEEERRKRDSLADCTHGFYGYYDGSNDYYKAGYVMGVVEGYGETVIGTRGFRCMKARILAIRIPKHVPDRLRAMILRNYPDIPVFDTFKQMVAEFPPDDAGVGITPDSDPEFWTRTI